MEKRIFILCLAATGAVLAGCGGGSSNGTSSPGGTTAQSSRVPVLLSSSGNDRLSRFYGTITGLTLINRSGLGVDVLTGKQGVEFMHLNGGVEPLLTATVPQDTYVSAQISLSYADYTCIANAGTGLHINTYAVNPPLSTTVNLAGPITLNGQEGAALLLSLDTLKSAQFAACSTMDTSQNGQPPSTTTLTPVFDLSLQTLPTQPTNSANGKATDLIGIVSSVNAVQSSFAVSSIDGISWSLSSTGSTVYQGISGISALTPGMAVDMDAAIQADGSLLAERVAVPDSDTSNLTTFNGGVITVDATDSSINLYAATSQGELSGGVEGQQLDIANASYQWSGRFSNVSSLPFSASFDASNMVDGQNTYVTNHLLYSNCCQRDPATTITLMPQTIDGTITAISSAGSFTTYTVALSSYDAFPTLAVQQGQTTLLQQPSTVVVYADDSTQMLNATPASVGVTLRFNGLIFNDNGTLRMDCAEILDGVAQ